MVGMMSKTVADQENYGNWRYAAVRPQQIPPFYPGPHIHVYADCSDGARMIARWSGVKDDPAGYNWQPFGNSTSIFFHLHHIHIAEVQPGDIFTFGYHMGEHHACMAYKYESGKGWLVWNHGAQGQPHIVSLAVEQLGHAGMIMTCCQLNVVDPPPTPEDKLRAKTGFYSWVAWRLGEGPWRKYGKLNGKVRPNVPTVVSLRWWKDYAAFLRARKQGNKGEKQ